MMRAVLADTGPLYAAADPSDQYHERAQDELERLEKQAISVVVPYPTLLEAYTLVLRRLGTRHAHTWVQEALAGAGIINPAPRDYANAVHRCLDHPDQALTLFDAVLAALSGRLGIPVWTYDRHFEAMRVARWR